MIESLKNETANNRSATENETFSWFYQTFSSFSIDYKPNVFEWFLMTFACVIFVIGFVGNLLVIVVVAKNAHMRTVGNIYFANLAIGDFLVIVICLPPSIITDIAGTWWFGETMCKIIPFLQVLIIYIHSLLFQ